MNIGPTQIVPVAAEGSTTREPTPPARTPPVSGQGATQQNDNTQNEVSLAAMPDVVVEMHSDTSMGLPMAVYQFIDAKSGSVVLQIPSDQMLKLVRDIRQRLQQMEAEQSGGVK